MSSDEQKSCAGCEDENMEAEKDMADTAAADPAETEEFDEEGEEPDDPDEDGEPIDVEFCHYVTSYQLAHKLKVAPNSINNYLNNRYHDIFHDQIYYSEYQGSNRKKKLITPKGAEMMATLIKLKKEGMNEETIKFRLRMMLEPDNSEDMSRLNEEVKDTLLLDELGDAIKDDEKRLVVLQFLNKTIAYSIEEALVKTREEHTKRIEDLNNEREKLCNELASVTKELEITKQEDQKKQDELDKIAAERAEFYRKDRELDDLREKLETERKKTWLDKLLHR